MESIRQRVGQGWSGCSPSLIDHIYTTHPEKLIVENNVWGSSDHNLIGFKRKNGSVVENERMVQKRVFKNFKVDHFQKDVSEEQWNDILKEEDIDICVDLFNSRLCRILDIHCPVKKIQLRQNYTPWITPEIKEAQTELKWKKIKAQRSKNKDDQEDVQRDAKFIRSLFRKAEEDWRKIEAQKHESRPGMTYKQVKDQVGWSGGKQPRQLRDNQGKISNSPKKNANIMNNFYIQKVKTIRKNMVNTPVNEKRLDKLVEGKNTKP